MTAAAPMVATYTVTMIPIDSIIVGEDRFRKDLGDIPALAESIEDIGYLIHPITVDGNRELLAGARRLAAFKHLGWKEIPAFVRCEQ
jgi:ParB-like chromosome segregation protein Spo0J